jgi:DnaJ-class molecular chaperone
MTNTPEQFLVQMVNAFNELIFKANQVPVLEQKIATLEKKGGLFICDTCDGVGQHVLILRGAEQTMPCPDCEGEGVFYTDKTT